MTIRAMIDGKERDLTPEEESAFLAEQTAGVAPVPASISFRQFYQQLYVLGIITDVELIAAVKSNDMPAALAALVNAMPAEQKLQAQILIYGGTEIVRSHDMTAAIIDAFGWTAEQGDDFFRAAAAL